jgi:hypothetical protein
LETPQKPAKPTTERTMMTMMPQPQPLRPLATSSSSAKGVQPSLLTQVGMAGAAAVITVTFIHPMDVVKVNEVELEGYASSLYQS